MLKNIHFKLQLCQLCARLRAFNLTYQQCFARQIRDFSERTKSRASVDLKKDYFYHLLKCNVKDFLVYGC